MSTVLSNLLPDGGEPCVVASTTREGHRALHRLRPDLADRFVVVDVPPMPPRETLRMIRTVQPTFQTKYRVVFDQTIPEELVRQCERFCHWRAFPGKAFDYLRRLCSHGVGPANPEAGTTVFKRLHKTDVRAMFKQETGLPDFVLSEDKPIEPGLLEGWFRKEIVAQDRAISEIVRAIRRFRTGLADTSKPVASFLFAGASGAGKTELACLLAELLFGSRERLLSFPMSQYRGDSGVGRLFGSQASSPTVSARFSSGSLVDAVRATPFSVVLLDEIDQASSEVTAGLFQILDEGRLVEASGDEVSFRSTIIILSTNVGMESFFAKRIGVETGNGDVSRTASEEAALLKCLDDRFGTPFLNRITAVVPFRPLPREVLPEIAGKQIRRVERSLAGLQARQLSLSVGDDLLNHIIRVGFDEKKGARPMARAVQTFCVDPIAAHLSLYPTLRNRVLHLDLVDGGVRVVEKAAPLSGGEPKQ